MVASRHIVLVTIIVVPPFSTTAPGPLPTEIVLIEGRQVAAMVVPSRALVIMIVIVPMVPLAATLTSHRAPVVMVAAVSLLSLAATPCVIVIVGELAVAA